MFITRKIPEIGIKEIKSRYDVEINYDTKQLKKEELIEGVKGKDGLLCLLTDEIDSDVIEAGEDLKVISNFAVGYDNIDVQAATEKGIIVTNTPGVLTETTADLAWALILAVTRNLVKGDKFVRADKFKGWDPTLMLGHDVHGKTLGIIGMGNIGSAVARRSVGFEMEVIYHDRDRNEDMEEEIGAKFVGLETLLEEADIISVHVPLTEETKGMIGRDELEMMKDDAYLINTARGEIVDEEALIETLRSNNIAGAGIDVYADEPYGPNPNYYDLENVVLTPHLGSASYESRHGMVRLAVENLIDALEGRRPKHVVNSKLLNE